MDFIEDFVHLTDHLPSPTVYRRWAAIACIAAALERRMWFSFSAGDMFPNLYVLLVGGPASGKTIAVREASKLVAPCGIHIAPDAATKAAFIDALKKAHELKEAGGTLREYSALSVFSGEFGNMVTDHDHVFLNVLNNIYDAPPDHKDNVRHGDFTVHVPLPIITILGGTQPDYLGLIMPDSAWNTGFMTRTIMVYSDARIKDNNFFLKAPDKHPEWAKLRDHLKELTTWWGEVTWEESAMEEMLSWRSAGCLPAPEHPRLRYYNDRREFFVAKVAMCRMAGQGRRGPVSLEDFHKARQWLIEAELGVANIFADMTKSQSDRGTIEDLVSGVKRLWKGDPIPESVLLRLLVGKVAVERMERILIMATMMGYLERNVIDRTYKLKEQ